MEQAYSRWLTHVTEPELLEQLKNMSEQERQEAFCRELAFGTGGLRGILGAGTNRMNVYTVRRATQGLANYLKKQKLPLSAAIVHDSRRCGRAFAEAAACVLAANGVKVYLYPRLEPTPALSWAVRYFSCGAGICITRQATTPRNITAIRSTALTAARSRWTQQMPWSRRSPGSTTLWMCRPAAIRKPAPTGASNRSRTAFWTHMSMPSMLST